jgi:glycosyltransferase involved in cell wall biosynthesis
MQQAGSKVKIAIIAHIAYPISQPYAGGMEMHTHLLARHLSLKGHEVWLFASKKSDQSFNTVFICDPVGDDGANDALGPMGHDKAIIAYRIALEVIDSGDFDLVHNISLHHLPLLASKSSKVPWITALHVGPFQEFRESVELADRSMTFVTVSESLARGWRDIVGGLHVIGNGIDVSEFNYNPTQSPNSYAFWSGRVVPEKGLHFAIDAARIAGFLLVFAGPKRDLDYWNAEIEPRLGPDTDYRGHVNHYVIANLLGKARVTIVSPCWEEPFGLVVAEALACGTPVAAFRRGGVPVLLNEQCGRLAESDNVADLARAISEAALLDRKACRDLAVERYDAKLMTDEYEKLYDAVVAERRYNLP